MRFTLRLTLALILCHSIAGCGGSPEAVPVSVHNGTMIALADKKGFFEIDTESGGNADRGSRSKGGTKSIVVYFYQPDGTTEMNPAPTDVTVKVGTGSDSPVVTLSPRPSGGFASSPSAYPSGFRGQLNAKIGGDAVETPFMIR
jgi:hypothetical protein